MKKEYDLDRMKRVSDRHRDLASDTAKSAVLRRKGSAPPVPKRAPTPGGPPTMKTEYDFSKATQGTAAGIPAGAVFVQFDSIVSAVLFGDGPIEDRLQAASKRRRRTRRGLCSIALSPTEYRRLRPVLDRLGAKAINPPAPAKPRRKSA